MIMLGLIGLGIFVGIFVGAAIPSKTRFSMKVAFLSASIVSFVCGIAVVVTLQFLWNISMVRQVRLKRDVDLLQDNVLKQKDGDPAVRGVIKKDSLGTQTFRKGDVIYMNFPMSLMSEDIEYVP